MESDLARLRDVKSADDFLHSMNRVCEASLTTDYWNITLPNELATSSPRSPSLFAYIAALVLLDAKVLFSEQRVSDALEPSVHSNRAAAERHHLFPKGHLKTLGYTGIRGTNQIANFALVDWGDNAKIADRAPADHCAAVLPSASPCGPGPDVLLARSARRLGAYGISGFPAGRAGAHGAGHQGRIRALGRLYGLHRRMDLEELIGTGETTTVEFKSCLRKNLHTGQADSASNTARSRPSPASSTRAAGS